MSNHTEDGVRKTDNRDTMEFRHEVVIPNEDLPFKMFIFEGKDGNYKVSTHWHQSVEIFLVTEGTIDFYIDSHYFSHSVTHSCGSQPFSPSAFCA